VLFYPEGESSVLVIDVVASTLGTELVSKPIEHRCQVLLGEFFVLFPCGYDCRLEFLFVEFRWVGVVGLGRIDCLRFFAVHA